MSSTINTQSNKKTTCKRPQNQKKSQEINQEEIHVSKKTKYMHETEQMEKPEEKQASNNEPDECAQGRGILAINENPEILIGEYISQNQKILEIKRDNNEVVIGSKSDDYINTIGLKNALKKVALYNKKQGNDLRAFELCDKYTDCEYMIGHNGSCSHERNKKSTEKEINSQNTECKACVMTGPGRRPYHTCGLVNNTKSKEHTGIADELQKIISLKEHLTEEQYEKAIEKILK